VFCRPFQYISCIYLPCASFSGFSAWSSFCPSPLCRDGWPSLLLSDAVREPFSHTADHMASLTRGTAGKTSRLGTGAPHCGPHTLLLAAHTHMSPYQRHQSAGHQTTISSAVHLLSPPEIGCGRKGGNMLKEITNLFSAFLFAAANRSAAKQVFTIIINGRLPRRDAPLRLIKDQLHLARSGQGI